MGQNATFVKLSAKCGGKAGGLVRLSAHVRIYEIIILDDEADFRVTISLERRFIALTNLISKKGTPFDCDH